MERITAAQAAERITEILIRMEEDLEDIIVQYHDAELDAVLMQLDRIARAYEALDKMTSTCCQSSPLAA